MFMKKQKKALQLIIKLITKLRCDINITGTLIVSYLSKYNKGDDIYERGKKE